MSHFLGVGKVFLGKSKKIRTFSEICIFSLYQTFNANIFFRENLGHKLLQAKIQFI